MSVDSRPASQLGTARAPLIINPVLAELLEQDKRNPDPIDVSEVCVLLHLMQTNSETNSSLERNCPQMSMRK